RCHVFYRILAFGEVLFADDHHSFSVDRIGVLQLCAETPPRNVGFDDVTTGPQLPFEVRGRLARIADSKHVVVGREFFVRPDAGALTEQRERRKSERDADGGGRLATEAFDEVVVSPAAEHRPTHFARGVETLE